MPTISPLFSCSSGFHFVFIMLTLLACGDIESNPGPKRRDSRYNFSICYWNLNSMTVHNFEKINLLEACNIINKFNVICLSESYLDSSIASDNDDLNIKGYNLHRTDHPNKLKEAVYVRILGNHYLLDALLMHIYKNALYLKFLLVTKRLMLFHCIDPLVKHLINLSPLSIILRNL